jgi:uncharacterized protein YybS (DUF2232 family)
MTANSIVIKMVNLTRDFTDNIQVPHAKLLIVFLIGYLISFTADVWSLKMSAETNIDFRFSILYFRFSVPWMYAIMLMMHCCVGATLDTLYIHLFC